MRRLDHSAIFLAIAGAYTPIMAVALDGWQKTVVLALVWGGTIVGMTLEWLPVQVPRSAVHRDLRDRRLVGGASPFRSCTTASVLQGSGWCSAAGLLYTMGAVVYALKRPDPWPRVFGFHEIFHLFTIAGAGCHLAAIAFYVVPLM